MFNCRPGTSRQEIGAQAKECQSDGIQQTTPASGAHPNLAFSNPGVSRGTWTCGKGRGRRGHSHRDGQLQQPQIHEEQQADALAVMFGANVHDDNDVADGDADDGDEDNAENNNNSQSMLADWRNYASGKRQRFEDAYADSVIWNFEMVQFLRGFPQSLLQIQKLFAKEQSESGVDHSPKSPNKVIEERFNKLLSRLYFPETEMDKGLKTIFSDVFLYVNGWTYPTADQIKLLMQLSGGGFSLHVESRTTHTIATVLSMAQKKQDRAQLTTLRPEWILDSFDAGKLLDIHEYKVMNPENNVKQIVGTNLEGPEQDKEMERPLEMSRTNEVIEIPTPKVPNSQFQSPQVLSQSKRRMHVRTPELLFLFEDENFTVVGHSSSVGLSYQLLMPKQQQQQQPLQTWPHGPTSPDLIDLFNLDDLTPPPMNPTKNNTDNSVPSETTGKNSLPDDDAFKTESFANNELAELQDSSIVSITSSSTSKQSNALATTNNNDSSKNNFTALKPSSSNVSQSEEQPMGTKSIHASPPITKADVTSNPETEPNPAAPHCSTSSKSNPPCQPTLNLPAYRREQVRNIGFPPSKLRLIEIRKKLARSNKTHYVSVDNYIPATMTNMDQQLLNELPNDIRREIKCYMNANFNKKDQARVGAKKTESSKVADTNDGMMRLPPSNEVPSKTSKGGTSKPTKLAKKESKPVGPSQLRIDTMFKKKPDMVQKQIEIVKQARTPEMRAYDIFYGSMDRKLGPHLCGKQEFKQVSAILKEWFLTEPDLYDEDVTYALKYFASLASANKCDMLLKLLGRCKKWLLKREVKGGLEMASWRTLFYETFPAFLMDENNLRGKIPADLFFYPKEGEVAVPGGTRGTKRTSGSGDEHKKTKQKTKTVPEGEHKSLSMDPPDST